MLYTGHGKVYVDYLFEGYRKKIWMISFNTECRSKPMKSLQHMQHGGFATVSGLENKINIAVQAFVDNHFDKLHFVHKKGA